MMIRYNPHTNQLEQEGQTVRGSEHLDLFAARIVGAFNSYNIGVFEAMAARDTPPGWHLSAGGACHDESPEPPVIPAAATEPILMGFVRVRSGDPHFPIWLWKQH